MSIKIKKATKDDLNGIYNLYRGEKSMEEIRWVLKNFEGSDLRSFIATDSSNNIIGHIGYVISNYSYKNSLFKGLHNMMWIVNPKTRGGAGLKLFAENIKMADFGFAIGASRFTKKLFPLIKYQHQFNIYHYFKFISPFSLVDDNQNEKICIEQVENFKFPIKNKYNGKDVFRSNPSENHLNWILECPLVKSVGFRIKKNGETIGVAICYIKTRYKIFKTGRIVHISYLGDNNNLWYQVVKLINKYFYEMNCYLVFAPASYPSYIKGLFKNGYRKSSWFFKPFYLDNSKKNLPGIKSHQYHLTFIESDLGYRNF